MVLETRLPAGQAPPSTAGQRTRRHHAVPARVAKPHPQSTTVHACAPRSRWRGAALGASNATMAVDRLDRRRRLGCAAVAVAVAGWATGPANGAAGGGSNCAVPPGFAAPCGHSHAVLPRPPLAPRPGRGHLCPAAARACPCVVWGLGRLRACRGHGPARCGGTRTAAVGATCFHANVLWLATSGAAILTRVRAAHMFLLLSFAACSFSSSFSLSGCCPRAPAAAAADDDDTHLPPRHPQSRALPPPRRLPRPPGHGRCVLRWTCCLSSTRPAPR